MDSAPGSPAPPPEAAPRACPNCGAPAPGRFCPACGQRQDRRLARYVPPLRLRVYGQSVAKTLAKYVLLFAAYRTALLLLVATTIVIVLTT